MFFVDHGFVDISMMFCFRFFLLLGDLLIKMHGGSVHLQNSLVEVTYRL